MTASINNNKNHYCLDCGAKVRVGKSGIMLDPVATATYDHKGNPNRSVYVRHVCSASIPKSQVDALESVVKRYKSTIANLGAQDSYDASTKLVSQRQVALDDAWQVFLDYEWEYALQRDCDKCGASAGDKCTDMRKGYAGRAIKRPHAERLPDFNTNHQALTHSKLITALEQSLGSAHQELDKVRKQHSRHKDATATLEQLESQLRRLQKVIDRANSVEITDNPF